jgi:signal transduction histidine kinase
MDARAERVDISEVARTAVAALGQPASAVRVVGPDHADVAADVDHVEQIVLNYVGNAIKYGGAPITVEISVAGAFVELRVCDEGDGIAEEFVARLFEKFAQASTGAARHASGTGLGLSIVRGLARANGGDAWYEPNVPHGSRFAVRLPVWPAV